MRLPFPSPFTGGLLRPARLPAAIGMFLFFCAGYASGVLMPFFALWAKQVAGIPTASIGLLLGCYSGGELLATPLIGGIADRIGRRPVLLMSSAGVGLGFLLLYFVHGVAAAALVLILIGVFESVLHPTIATVIAEAVPAARTRHYFSLARVASNVGRIAGPATGAVLALRSLGAVFFGAAAASLAGALVAALWLPETWDRTAPAQGDDEDDDSLAGLLPALRDKRLAGMLLWTMCLQISAGWIGSVLPLYASDNGLLTPSRVGLLFTYSAALIVVFQLLMTRMLGGVSSFRLVLASGVALAAAFAVLLAVPGVAALIGAVTLLAAAEMLLGPLIPVTVNALAPPGARATYMAAASVMADLEDTVGPAVGTFLYALGTRLPWLLGIPVALAAALALAYTVRRHERAPTAGAPSAEPPGAEPTARCAEAE